MARMTKVRTGPVTAAQRLMTERYAKDRDVSDYEDDDTKDVGMPVQIDHTRSSKTWVFVLTPSGCIRREISSNSIGGHEGVLNNPNYSAECWDCGDRSCGPGINDCPGRPKKKFRICPITTCRKRVYDPLPTGRHLESDGMSSGFDDDEEGAIVDEAYTAVDAEARTKLMLDLHILGYHEAEAAAYGVHPPMLTAVAR